MIKFEEYYNKPPLFKNTSNIYMNFIVGKTITSCNKPDDNTNLIIFKLVFSKVDRAFSQFSLISSYDKLF